MTEALSGQPLNVVICGAGKTGHLATVLFKQRPDVKVTLLGSHPRLLEAYQQNGKRLHALLPDGETLTATPDCVTCDPAEACRDADIVIITVPANFRADLLARIVPHLPSDKPVYVGAIPGFCGFDWLAERELTARPNAVIWGMKDVAHIAFDLLPGQSIKMGGEKAALYVATHRRETAASQQALMALLQRLYAAPVVLLPDYLEITLTPGNPIMHSAVIYGLIGPYGQWHARPLLQPLCWWNDCPELGAYYLERMDEENQQLCAALETRLGVRLDSVLPLKQEIIDAYGDQIADAHTMLSVLRTNQAYHGIGLPLRKHDAGGYVFDTRHRVFQEDIAYGLSLLVTIAENLAVSVPYIEEVYRWCSDYMGTSTQDRPDYFPPHWLTDEMN
ncbi:NAD/NADP octopine/nopaline dehydrogenase family protein [Pectobacterium sp. FL60-S17]|uniref:2-dehydropantoate 2-reductase n=1 Tax=Pectobacterium quasiaquaticum TaxID=2774015 RepID=A0A9Q2EYI0_9GAMM|nr:NAD/NADP-dependent octopine/nopaline dehydrogenase family protein [Pectobacterium quasiaquaticum]MBE5201047.1 NAD/NADP octopine/nopaline dehydrogenase family protein [Pectobacterium quasiaquaticum]MBE5209967.1 NAD/NADP octopine/nopaline dehydrogenase family protein [Pectobacterium quasiaquaticum]MBE5221553.1 NAD/NADP octopine/nopaline dehydrogenase family protein [Pectobacterium quasiaquaticum]URG48700.1 NAD/NADP octopine/nopaline dehydrogenase family protein [Pectobacterium quasiaquaticum]